MLTARGDDAPDQPPGLHPDVPPAQTGRGFSSFRQRPQQTVFPLPAGHGPRQRREALRQMGVERVFALGPDAGGGPTLPACFRDNAQGTRLPVRSFAKAAASLVLAMLQAGFVDEFHLHYAPLVLLAMTRPGRALSRGRAIKPGRGPAHADLLGDLASARAMPICSCARWTKPEPMFTGIIQGLGEITAPQSSGPGQPGWPSGRFCYARYCAWGINSRERRLPPVEKARRRRFAPTLRRNAFPLKSSISAPGRAGQS